MKEVKNTKSKAVMGWLFLAIWLLGFIIFGSFPLSLALAAQTAVLVLVFVFARQAESKKLKIAGILAAVCHVLAVLLLGYLLLTGPKPDFAGLEKSQLKQVSVYDDHGGFLGDGVSCHIYNVKGDSPAEAVKAAGWKPLPLDELTHTLVYEYSDSLFRDEKGNLLVPEIEHGYWYFRDRQDWETEKEVPTPILQRPSFNFTVGLYDADTNLLYLLELDT